MFNAKNKSRENVEPANKKKLSNERAFKDIDSEEKSYWLGYFSADGCISTDNKGSYRISITSIDLDIIYGFMDFLGSRHKICENKLNKNTAYTVTFGSKIMFNDLLLLGVKPNKTTNLEPPAIKENLIRHYIRGYIDGDGSVCVSKEKTGKSIFSVSVVGRESVISWITKHLSKACELKSTGSYKFKTLTVLKRTQKQAIKIAEYIYKDNIVCLKRKEDKYKEYIGVK